MNIYDISVKKRGGEEVSLADFKGKVLLALTEKDRGDRLSDRNLYTP